jgi:hypothetical protein
MKGGPTLAEDSLGMTLNKPQNDDAAILERVEQPVGIGAKRTRSPWCHEN